MTDSTITGIAAAQAVAEGCEVAWQGGAAPAVLPWLWLRENCPCPACYNDKTHQREVDTAGLPPEIAGAGLRAPEDGTALEVTWSHGGHESRYPAKLLRDLCAADESAAGARPERFPWDAAGIAERVPALPHDRVMADEGSGLLELLDSIDRIGFGFVRGVPATLEDTRALVERIGYIRETIFGGLWTFSAEAMEHSDSAYSTQALRPHTDGTYSHDAPGLQVFHCLGFDGEGGESILVDGLRIAEDLRRDEPGAFRVLTSVGVTGRYIEPGVHLRATRPVFRLDRDGRVVQVSFNNYDRAPVRLPNEVIPAFYGALRAFEIRANDPAMQFHYPLRPGEVLLIDNWRVLHSRAAYSGKRKMAGCYVNREDFESKLRVLRLAR